MTAVHRLRAALRDAPLAADALLATAVLVVVLFVGDPDRPGGVAPLTPLSVALAVSTCAALVLRRRYPVPVLAVSVAGSAAAAALPGGGRAVAASALIALYTVAARSDRRTTWIAWAVTAAVLTLAGLITAARAPTNLDFLAYLDETGVAAALGIAVRNRRAYVLAVEERAERAEQNREEEARRRVAEERLHIARELHDVVAHRIAVVQVQAGVASHLLTSQPEAAREALGHVRRAGSEILDELTGILNVLRRPDEATDPTTPAPSLAQIETLIASFAAAGLAVDWSLTGCHRPVGAAVDLVAYRVLEEALTNAHKHGTGAAQVAVDYNDHQVVLRVTNAVRTVEPQQQPRAAGGGHGLLGMRERAAAVGGVLQAGPGPDGQFHVEAALPLHASVAA